MTAAIFVVPLLASGPDVDIDQIVTDASVDGYGYGIVGNISAGQTTCVVRIDSTEEVLSTLAENSNYVFLEDIIDASETP